MFPKATPSGYLLIDLIFLSYGEFHDFSLVPEDDDTVIDGRRSLNSIRGRYRTVGGEEKKIRSYITPPYTYNSGRLSGDDTGA